MSKYRERLQIVADILLIAGRGAKKTQIMYQANLSYRLLCRYLGEVLSAGLVSFENRDCYVLTAKGKEFLDKYKKYSKRCRRLSEQFKNVNNVKSELQKMCSNTGKIANK